MAGKYEQETLAYHDFVTALNAIWPKEQPELSSTALYICSFFIDQLTFVCTLFRLHSSQGLMSVSIAMQL